MLIGIGLIILVGLLGYRSKARFQLNCWLFNEPVDEILDTMIKKSLKSGIKSVSITDDFYGLNVAFKDGVVMWAWNENKYYAWLNRGSIGAYKWRSVRPSAEAMVALRDAIKQYYLS